MIMDMEHVSPATRLLEKRRTMFEVNEQLEKQKQEFERQQEALRIRQEEHHRKENVLSDQLTKFNKYCQENDAKTNRAGKRLDEEKQQCELKDQQIKRHENDLEEQSRDKAELDAQVGQNIKYQKYLERVVDFVSEDYGEIAEILNRHKTLKSANEDLKARQKDTSTENEEKRAEFSLNVKEGTNLILNFNNEIARKQKELEQCEARRIGLQNDVDNAVRHDSDKKSELGMILMAVQNLVQRCEKRNKGVRRRRKNEEVTSSKTTKADMERKGEKAQRDLTTIQQYLSNYEDILKQCPKEAKNYKGGASAV